MSTVLKSLFERVGLGEEELDAYLALWEGGTLPAGSVAKRLGIPRSTVYGHLAALAQRGLASTSERRGVKVYQAESPEQMGRLLRDETSKLSRLTSAFDAMLPELVARRSSTSAIPRFRYFEGRDGLLTLVEEVLLHRDVVTQTFWPAQTMIDVLGTAAFFDLNRRRIQRNIHVDALWPRDHVVDIHDNPFFGYGEDFKRNIRLAPEEIECPMGYWIIGDKVFCFSSAQESFGFIIESVEFRRLMKTQFDFFWSVSQPLGQQSPHVSALYTERSESECEP